MDTIYTIFTLADPEAPADVRFVGFTSQSLPKRVGDIVAGAQVTYTRTYNTLLGEWIRYLLVANRRPEVTVIFEDKNMFNATKVFRDTINQHVSSGMLLNSKVGPVPKSGGSRALDEEVDHKMGGRPVSHGSENADLQAKRKASKNDQ